MGREWGKITLADALEFVVDNRGKTVPACDKGIALIATNCVSNENLYPEHINVRYVSEETYNNWFRAHPEPNDILLTNKGSKNGAVCLVPDPVSFCIAQDMVALRADRSKIDPTYLFAALRSSCVQAQIKQLNVDSVIPHFKKTDFDKLFIPLPSGDEQKYIGQLYLTFSTKIELNRRMNETLEGMAQALFKSWFSDFDPVLDNILMKNLATYSDQNHPSPPPLPEGEELSSATQSLSLWERLGEGAFVGIPENFLPRAKTRLKAITNGTANREIAKHFPAAFQETDEMGWIPEGWEVSTIDTEYNVVMGQSPKGDTYNEVGEGTLFYQGRAEFGWRFPTPRLYTTEPKRMAKAGDALMSVRAPVGDFNMALNDCCVGRGLCVLSHKWGSSSFTYYQMKEFRKHLDKFNGEGTVFGSVNQKDLKAQKCLAPPVSAVNAFVEIVESIDSKILNNSNQVMALTKIRDNLLPELISGELIIDDKII